MAFATMIFLSVVVQQIKQTVRATKEYNYTIESYANSSTMICHISYIIYHISYIIYHISYIIDHGLFLILLLKIRNGTHFYHFCICVIGNITSLLPVWYNMRVQRTKTDMMGRWVGPRDTSQVDRSLSNHRNN